jgi:3-oxoadipate enol-lactonase
VSAQGIRDVQGRNSAWRESGPPDADEIVVLLHGLGGSRISWEPQLSGLGERFRVIAWDMPGYGASPALTGPMTFTALAQALVALIDEVGIDEVEIDEVGIDEVEIDDAGIDEAGAGRVHLVGISFGGMIAQYAAAQASDRFASLSLLATSPKFGLDGTRPEAWRAARLAPLDAGQEPIDFAEAVLASLAGPHVTAAALAGQRAAMARVTAAALRRSIDCLITHDSQAILPDVVAPTLCLVGELDTETPVAYSQAIVDLVPGAKLQVVPGAGHLLNVEAPEVVNAAIADHIAAARTARR